VQNPGWCLAPKYYDGFPNPKPLPGGNNPNADYGSGESSVSATNMQLDAQGKVLFFVENSMIYDGEGYWIGVLNARNEFLNNTNVRGDAEVLIIPDPGSCSRYYIVLSGFGANDSESPCYAILDMSLESDILPGSGIKGRLMTADNGYGDETAFSLFSMDMVYNNIIPYNYVQKYHNISYAASKLRSDNTRFLFVGYGGITLKYIISAAGIVFNDHFYTDAIHLTDRNEMELHEYPDGTYRIAVQGTLGSNTPFEGSTISTVKLNSQGVPISGGNINIKFPKPTVDNASTFDINGLEFSPDGNKLFFSHRTSNNNPNPIGYYDFTTNSLHHLTLQNDDDFQLSQIELRSDGKLYLATSDRMASLDPMSSNTTTFGWNNNAVSFSGFVYRPNDGYTILNPYDSPEVVTLYGTKLYTLPDQIDGMDYSAHFFANESCCVMYKAYDTESRTISGTATWQPGATSNPFESTTGEIYVTGTLTFAAGSNITIKNMKFKFAPDAKVVVERGASGKAGANLTLDNTIFTADVGCKLNNMWLGVEVLGYPNQPQTGTTVQQGWFIMKNNAMIEHSIHGVTATKIAILNSSLYDDSYSGGVIQGTSSKFRNNHRDVTIWSYTAPAAAPNKSFFSHCDFYTDGLMNSPLSMFVHVYLNNTEGITFTACNFENKTPELYSYTNRGTGISSYSAKYSVVGQCGGLICSNYTPSTFKNLNYGINSNSSYIPLRSAYVDGALFKNNVYGARLYGIDGTTIIRSTFELYEAQVPTNYGIYLDNCTRYKIEENNFTELPTDENHSNSYGIVVNASGEEHNEIYKNTFQNVNVGVQAQLINGEIKTPTNAAVGLQIRCNTFNQSIYQADIAVTSGRIDYQQGYCIPVGSPSEQLMPAGNRFSQTWANSESDFKANSGVQYINYAHHTNAITTPYNYTTSIITIQNCGIALDYGKACPSKLTPRGSRVCCIDIPFERVFLTIDSLHRIIANHEEQLAASGINQMQGKGEQSNEGDVETLITQLQIAKSELANYTNEALRFLLFDTTLTNRNELLTELIERENINIEPKPFPDYLQDLPDSVSAEQGFYLALISGNIPPAIIEPIVEGTNFTGNLPTTTVVSHLSIFPNPSATDASVNFSLQNVENEDVLDYSIGVYSVLLAGEKLFSQAFEENQTQLSVPSNTLQAGFYFVKLFKNDVLIETKMMSVQ
jgi:hypothetical protein